MKKTVVQSLFFLGVLLLKSLGIEDRIGGGIKSLDVMLDFFLIFIGIRLLQEIIILLYQRKKGLEPHITDNIIAGIRNIFVILISVVAVLTIITILGYDVKEILSSLTIIAAAITIISKDYISNIIGGMLIAFSNDVNIGDYIKVGNNKGKVIGMSVSMISLLTDDDDVVVIPNSTVYALELVNYTKRTIKKTSIEFEMDLEAIQNVKNLEETLIQILKDYEDLIEPNSYNLKTVAIKKDFVEFKFQYILNLPNKDLEKEIRKKVIRKVIRIIKNTDAPTQKHL